MVYALASPTQESILARKVSRPEPTCTHHLDALYQDCPTCQRRLWSDYRNYRTVATLLGLMRLVLRSRRCHNADCPRYLRPYRPEAAGRHALPQHAFGLDVIALVGARRSAEHRSVPAIHHLRTARGLAIAQRTVTNLLDRDDELLAVTRTDADRLRGLLADQGRVLLASDGLQPDVGHEVLWGLRDCLAGTVLLARSLLSSRPQELAARSGHVRDGLPVPSTGVLSDGQHSSRKAVAQALPGDTNSATCTTCARPPGPSPKPIATPRRNCSSASAAFARVSVRWSSAPTPRPRPSGVTATPSAVP